MPCRGPADTRQRALAPDLQRNTHQRRFTPTAPRSPAGQSPTEWRLGVGKEQTAGPRWDSPVIAAWNLSTVASGGAVEEVPPRWGSGARTVEQWSSGAELSCRFAAWKQLDSVFTFTLLAAGTSGGSHCSTPTRGGGTVQRSREKHRGSDGWWWMVKVEEPLSSGDGDEPGVYQNCWHVTDVTMEACFIQHPTQNNSNHTCLLIWSILFSTFSPDRKQIKMQNTLKCN